MKHQTFLTTTLAVLCSAIFIFGVQARPASAASMQTHHLYSVGQWFQPDGTSHTFTYDQPCLTSVTKGCVVHTEITVTATRNAAITPNDNWWSPEYETITDDYKTCTGAFGYCYDNTEAKLVSNFTYNSLKAFNPYSTSMYQYCGGSNWSCQGIAGTSSNAWNGSYAEDNYGPQQYQRKFGVNQSKWAIIRVRLDGSYYFSNSCTGSLC